MMAPHAGLERRVLASLDAAPSRVPVVLGGCGTGRTTLLHGVADRLGRTSCQYVDVERAASTPERFYHAVVSSSPFVDPGVARGEITTPSSARDAFDRTLAFCQRARTPDGQPATFLLDEVLELRTFENFPGLRQVLRELVQAVADSPNRFMCSSRYVARAHRVLRDAAARFEVVHLPPLAVADVAAMLPPGEGMSAPDRDDLAATIHALADGRAAYVRAIGDMTASMSQRGGDPISAMTALLTSDGTLTAWCGYRYEIRLHRARLRRAQGHPRDSGRRRTAHAHRDLATPAAHAGLHEGLPVVARRRGPRGGTPEALQLRRSGAAPLGATARPAHAARRGRRGARGAGLRVGAPAPGRADDGSGWHG